MEWDEGPRLFQHFRDFEGVLRVSDIPGYVRSLGFSPPPILPKTIQGTGMRHRGVNIGNFFLAGKSGGQEFTKEDEEVLVLFAAQAATAIANARTYRDEHRTRADLEALVDTSPVGVAVFDARTGQPVLLNREARRIVEGLVVPGQSAEQLLEVMKCRRADGREISLEKLPLAQLLSSATTVRAEEIVLEVPGGRSVTTLINATPIHSQDGVVESVVVTLQDMAPLEEMERSRAEFLSLVSHELRAPLSSIKGSAATVRDASPAPDLAEILQFFRIIEEQADHMRGLISDLLDAGRIEAGSLSVTPEPAQVADLVDQARTTFLSGGDRHTLLIDLPPDLPRVLADRDRIVQVLNNLFSNTSRHSPETFPIRVSAVQDGVYLAISVSDEGGGYRRSSCHTCSASTRVWETAMAGSGDRAWGWPSARGWWKPTGGASGPRAAEQSWARGSLSRFRWPSRPPASPLPDSLGVPRTRLGKDRREHPSWWWTTTR